MAPNIINCPSGIYDSTDLHKNTSSVNWAVPTASDNSGIAVEAISTFTPPHKFPIGDTIVPYTATDGVGNVGSCDFTVTITGKS